MRITQHLEPIYTFHTIQCKQSVNRTIYRSVHHSHVYVLVPIFAIGIIPADEITNLQNTPALCLHHTSKALEGLESSLTYAAPADDQYTETKFGGLVFWLLSIDIKIIFHAS
jgi:hypothetical protein